MKISKEQNVFIFNEKGKEIIDNFKKLCEALSIRGREHHKEKVLMRETYRGERIYAEHFVLDNDLYVYDNPDFYFIADGPKEYLSGIPKKDIMCLYALRNSDGYTINLQGIEKGMMIFSTSIEISQDGKIIIDNNVGENYLDTNDHSIFDLAKRNIDIYTTGRANKYSTEKLKQFKEMVGLNELERNGNLNESIIRGLVETVASYREELGPEGLSQLKDEVEKIRLETRLHDSSAEIR